MRNEKLQGYLDRKGMFGFWTKRWCVISNSSIIIFKDETQLTVEHSIPIDENTKIHALEDGSHRFTVKPTNEPASSFRASTKEMCNLWVSALQSIARNTTSVSIASFNLISVLGRGYYGKVTLGQKIDTGELFAIKSIHKSKVAHLDKMSSVLAERNILISISHPFIVSMSYAFQTPTKFYFCMEYLPTDLYHFIRSDNPLSLFDIKLYCAEISLALEHLHRSGIVYRDLKPENVLIGKDGHIKLTDFGLSKDITNSCSKTSTFCGTAEFLAPEIINKKPYGFSIDWWALGVLLYELIYKKTPFASDNELKMFDKIVNEEVSFPTKFDQTMEDLINGLLDKNPTKRFGYEQVKSHLNEFDFYQVYSKNIEPENAHVYPVSDLQECQSDSLNDSSATPVQNSVLEQFKGFSFDGGNIIPDASALQAPTIIENHHPVQGSPLGIFE